MEFSKIPGIVEIDFQKIIELKREAATAPLKRARYCLHRSTGDAVQEMVIAFQKGSYIRPHRHSQKSESFHLLEGGLVVLFFDDLGVLSHRIRMDKKGGILIFRNHTLLWHTVILLTDFAVVHEIATGPFIKEKAEFAPWSPVPDSIIEVNRFLERMEALCL